MLTVFSSPATKPAIRAVPNCRFNSLGRSNRLYGLFVSCDNPGRWFFRLWTPPFLVKCFIAPAVSPRGLVMKPLHRMSTAELKEYMKELSNRVERLLPQGPTKHGKCQFALVLAGEDGKAHYVSNSKQRPMTKAVRKVADRIERKRRDNDFVVLKALPIGTVA